MKGAKDVGPTQKSINLSTTNMTKTKKLNMRRYNTDVFPPKRVPNFFRLFSVLITFFMKTTDTYIHMYRKVKFQVKATNNSNSRKVKM